MSSSASSSEVFVILLRGDLDKLLACDLGGGPLRPFENVFPCPTAGSIFTIRLAELGVFLAPFVLTVRRATRLSSTSSASVEVPALPVLFDDEGINTTSESESLFFRQSCFSSLIHE